MTQPPQPSSLLTPPSTLLSPAFSAQRLGALLALLALPLTACTNPFAGNSNLAGQNNAVSPNSANPGNYAFTIKQVLADAFNPASTLDVLGDGSGSLENNCPPVTAGDVTSNGPVQCVCQYTYVLNSTNQSVQTPIVYHEINQVRCSFSPPTPPVTISQIQVALVNTIDQAASNPLAFNTQGSGALLDTTQASSFAEIFRYQCRDVQTVPSLFFPAMYDPFQSENPHISYPLNFYAGNLGDATNQYVSASQNNPSAWICPSILNPQKSLINPTAIATYQQSNQLSMGLYTKGTFNGTDVIYPPNPKLTPGFDRTTFYLAKNSSGSFSVAVNGMYAPLLPTTTSTAINGRPLPPLGYGVAAIPGRHSGEEACPSASSVPIPAGFQFMKLWLFKAGLAPRSYMTAGTPPAGVNNILCNPGDWQQGTATGGSITTPVFSGCFLTPGSTPSPQTGNLSVSLNNIDFPPGMRNSNSTAMSNSYLADRVLDISSPQAGAGGDYICLTLQGQNTITSTSVQQLANACSSGLPGPACMGNPLYATPVDFWQAYAPAAIPNFGAIWATVNDKNFGCGSNPQKPIYDPLQICKSANIGAITSVVAALQPTYSGPTGAGGGLQPLSLDIVNGQSTARNDYVFIVTPPIITSNQMAAISSTGGSSPAAAYLPYRFLAFSDCKAGDPLTAPAGDCNPNENVVTYNLLLTDLTAPNGSTPIYPICVLQPVAGGGS